ncbi:AMP-binding protein [Streptomyces sp. NPDC014892]|uniref:AMP-binding protein n=1 Tax=Streptomyces sp. NPDC014892 TaxID=3364930 RepID=UPI00370362EE
MLDHSNLDATAAMGCEALELGPDDRCLLILPLFHVNAIVISVLIPLFVGASIAIADRFDPSTARSSCADPTSCAAPSVGRRGRRGRSWTAGRTRAASAISTRTATCSSSDDRRT